jgi:hypothetical protein
MVVIDDGRQRDDAHCEEISHQFSYLSVITAFLLPRPPPPPPAPVAAAAAAAAGHGMYIERVMFLLAETAPLHHDADDDHASSASNQGRAS